MAAGNAWSCIGSAWTPACLWKSSWTLGTLGWRYLFPSCWYECTSPILLDSILYEWMLPTHSHLQFVVLFCFFFYSSCFTAGETCTWIETATDTPQGCHTARIATHTSSHTHSEGCYINTFRYPNSLNATVYITVDMN